MEVGDGEEPPVGPPQPAFREGLEHDAGDCDEGRCWLILPCETGEVAPRSGDGGGSARATHQRMPPTRGANLPLEGRSKLTERSGGSFGRGFSPPTLAPPPKTATRF
jgi:hypothetical protein